MVTLDARGGIVTVPLCSRQPASVCSNVSHSVSIFVSFEVNRACSLAPAGPWRCRAKSLSPFSTAFGGVSVPPSGGGAAAASQSTRYFHVRTVSRPAPAAASGIRTRRRPPAGLTIADLQPWSTLGFAQGVPRVLRKRFLSAGLAGYSTPPHCPSLVRHVRFLAGLSRGRNEGTEPGAVRATRAPAGRAHVLLQCEEPAV